MPKLENRSKTVRILRLETKHARARDSSMTCAIHLRGSRTISTPTTKALHGLSNADRRIAERALWRNGLAGALIVHLLIFFLWWGEAELVSPFAAAGPRAGDNLAASGGMQTFNIRVPPPRPIIRPQVPILTFDPILPVELEEDQQIETASILGDRPGVDGPGLLQGDGRGDGGTAETGRFRAVPPSLRGAIIPPTNRNVRGQTVEVWLWVDEEGRVVADSTRLRPPTSDRAYNQRLLRDAADWVFEPGKSGAGEAVAAWFNYEIRIGGG